MLSRKRFVQVASLGVLGLAQAACTVVYAKQNDTDDSLRDIEWQPDEGLYPFADLDASDVSSAVVCWDLLGTYDLDIDEIGSLVSQLNSLEAPASEKQRDLHLSDAAFRLTMTDGSVCWIEMGTTTGAPYGYVDDGETYLMMQAAYLLVNGAEHDMYIEDIARFSDIYTACTDKLRASLPSIASPFDALDATDVAAVTVHQYYPGGKVDLSEEQIEVLLASLEGVKLISETAKEPSLVLGGYTYLLWMTLADGREVRTYISRGDTQIRINDVYIDIVDYSCNPALDWCATLF